MSADVESNLVSHIMRIAKYHVSHSKIREQPPSLAGFKQMIRTEYKTKL